MHQAQDAVFIGGGHLGQTRLDFIVELSSRRRTVTRKSRIV